MHARTGAAYHVSCHSMASIARAVSKDAGAPRSDFDIGNRHGETCDRAFVDTAHAFLEGLGYDVTVNKHFAGAESIRKHGNPSGGTHSLQIETRRGLYMDEETYEKQPEFETVRGHLGQLAAHLAAYASGNERDGA
jgi:N-formylglutamate amidohydrolase